MGVFEWIGVAEVVGLALLAMVLIIIARRRERANRAKISDAAASATIGTAAIIHEPPDFGSGFGGGDAGGG